MNDLLLLSMIGLIGFACQWIAQTTKLPAILFLLLVGILLGPTLGILNPDSLFGDLLFPFISLSVAVILFEGALTLKRRELKEIGQPVKNMVTIGVVISMAVVTIATHFIVGLSWSLSALFGALMVVTGPTVIVPMLKSIRPKRRVADVLRWEGVVIDPIGALVAVLVFEWIAVQHQVSEPWEIFTVFVGTVAIGLIVGLIAGYLFGLLMRYHCIPERLHNFSALSTVCVVFAVSDSIMHESGLLAVTVMGMLLANMKGVHMSSILDFKEDLTVVFVSVLFIVLAARLDFDQFAMLGWSAVFVLIAMQLIARPLKVFVSFLGSDFSFREKLLVAWVGPRGIVAAAISAVFAVKLEDLGIDGAELLVPLAFLIIIGTVVLQGLTARSLAKYLGVSMPKTEGVLIVGANDFSVALAQTLHNHKIDVLICDTNWDHLSRARLAGLPTYYGNPSSDHAARHMNLSPYGYFLGLSNHFENNASQANQFRDDFGSRNVFLLAPNQSRQKLHKHAISELNTGRFLFAGRRSYRSLKDQLNTGGEIKVTELTQEYDYTDWLEGNDNAIPIMVIGDSGDIVMNVREGEFEPDDGDLLVYLSESTIEKERH